MVARFFHIYLEQTYHWYKNIFQIEPENHWPDSQACHRFSDKSLTLYKKVSMGCGQALPVQNQPNWSGGAVSAIIPAPQPSSVQGLEYLCQVSQILVQQKVPVIKGCTLCEKYNRYEIKNSMGQQVYSATEETDCCQKYFCGFLPFTMTVNDNMGSEVIRLIRPLRCSLWITPCCLQKLEVQSPPGVTVGYVIQNWHPCVPKFTIQNEKEENVFQLTAPCLGCRCSALTFKVETVDGDSEVGRIHMNIFRLANSLCTNVKNYEIQFSLDLDVKFKAIMLSACFLFVGSKSAVASWPLSSRSRLCRVYTGWSLLYTILDELSYIDGRVLYAFSFPHTSPEKVLRMQDMCPVELEECHMTMVEDAQTLHKCPIESSPVLTTFHGISNYFTIPKILQSFYIMLVIDKRAPRLHTNMENTRLWLNSPH
ncbi:LOW QUALITY PROTEIN: phospholipid scramblase 2-like [Pelodytes ibericus]